MDRFLKGYGKKFITGCVKKYFITMSFRKKMYNLDKSSRYFTTFDIHLDNFEVPNVVHNKITLGDVIGQKNHRNIIVIGQIIGSGKIDSFRSIKSIIKSIHYPNFQNKLLIIVFEL